MCILGFANWVILSISKCRIIIVGNTNNTIIILPGIGVAVAAAVVVVVVVIVGGRGVGGSLLVIVKVTSLIGPAPQQVLIATTVTM